MIWPQLALIGGLVALNAAFAGSELALVSLREGQLRRLEQGSRTGARLARLARDPNRFLATIQIGITLAGFLASAVAATSLAEPLVEPLGFLGGSARAVAIVLVTLILSFVTLVFGELVPKRIAMQRAERWGLAVAGPLTALAALSRPVVGLLSFSTDAVVRVFGGDPSQQREAVTREELRELVAAQMSFTPQQRLIIDGAFEVSHRKIGQVMRPRPDVFVLDEAESSSEALRRLAASGHTRAPVAPDGLLDSAEAIVHLRDLLDEGERPVAEVATPLFLVSEAGGVLETLHEFQVRRIQLAGVVDEHGVVTGIVSAEDLVEEIVGEIYDETDRDVVAVRREGDGTLRVSGRFPIHDLEDIGVFDVPTGDYVTVAGLVLERLGRIPHSPGDRVEIAGRVFEVTAIGGRTITEVRIGPPPSPGPDSE
ncbi:MAG TPA: hemolysin family protein [Acidimicrobiia bacterium]|nr:hemolysin family protein [Acidimicrobiia bacterium]